MASFGKLKEKYEGRGKREYKNITLNYVDMK